MQSGKRNMGETRFAGMALACAGIALVVAVTAGFGAFARGDGSKASATSPRGERYQFVTSGVYAYNTERVVAEGVGWDWVTLFFAVPALLVAAPFVARGSLRARLFALGILAYFVYQYLMYSVYWAFGPLFVPFIVIYGSAAATIAWIVSSVDIDALPQSFSAKFPGKTMAVVCALMSLQLLMMWSQRIAAAYRGDFAEAGFQGMPTLTVQAMDLGMIVPLALATAVFAWRRRPWGYLLASVFAVKGVTMAGAICAMLVSAAMVEGRLEVGPFAIFVVATSLFCLLAWRIFGSITAEKSTSVAAPLPLGA